MFNFKENGCNKNACCILTFEMWVTEFWGKVDSCSPAARRAAAFSRPALRALLPTYPFVNCGLHLLILQGRSAK